MALSGWTALVHFAADETDFPKGWVARDVKFREGEFEGKGFQIELRAERSE
jgi:hypothetical protein